jgi:hypothetical protein
MCEHLGSLFKRTRAVLATGPSRLRLLLNKPTEGLEALDGVLKTRRNVALDGGMPGVGTYGARCATIDQRA